MPLTSTFRHGFLPLDLRGLRCPLVILRAAKAFRQAAPGALIEVLADDPGSERDLADFCASNQHELLSLMHLDNSVFRFVIRRN